MDSVSTRSLIFTNAKIQAAKIYRRPMIISASCAHMSMGNFQTACYSRKRTNGRKTRSLTWQRRRVAYEFPLSAHAAHVHGAANGGPVSDHRHPGANTIGSRWLPMGHVSAQS